MLQRDPQVCSWVRHTLRGIISGKGGEGGECLAAVMWCQHENGRLQGFPKDSQGNISKCICRATYSRAGSTFQQHPSRTTGDQSRSRHGAPIVVCNNSSSPHKISEDAKRNDCSEHELEAHNKFKVAPCEWAMLRDLFFSEKDVEV